MLKIVENIAEDIKDIFFNTVVSFVGYLDKNPKVSYPLYNCFFTGITIHESASTDDSADIQRAEIKFSYDYGRIVKPTNNK